MSNELHEVDLFTRCMRSKCTHFKKCKWNSNNFETNAIKPHHNNKNLFKPKVYLGDHFEIVCRSFE